ncbi:MAG TPA: universal stress protein [Solirubrobacteraceae bacterium]|nr:universal stress protein [Solirubrobacteraceae bacterium]
MILICYDGSEDARAAIEHAGELLRGRPATVLTVWPPFAHILASTPTGLGPMAGLANMEEIDEASHGQAQRHAREGTELARKSGLKATSRTCSQETTTADAILTEAEAVGAEAIVLGSRGLTGLKSLLLGSVSHAVIQHADRTVIVVPSPQVASARVHRHGAKQHA